MLFPTDPISLCKELLLHTAQVLGCPYEEGCAQTDHHKFKWEGSFGSQMVPECACSGCPAQAPPELPVISALGGGADKDTNNLSNYSCLNQFAALLALFPLWSQYQH